MKTILLLEDEVAVMEFLRHTLQQSFTILEAASAEEALRIFLDRNCRIDLLLAEVTLPKISGIQVALLLRTRVAELPVILTSGYPVRSWSDRDCADVGRLGSASAAIFQEPFEARALLHAAHELSGMSRPEEARPTSL